MSGKLIGVGVGPGDPDLLTLKAAKLIASANVVAYPAPDNGVSFARQIAHDHIREDATVIAMIVPMRTERFPAQTVYDKEAEQIAAYLDDGQDVVVLCEGDPFFFGSFMYLYNRLADHYETEIVPGVSSLMACASRLKHPLAARNDVLSVIPGPSESDVFRRHFAQGGSFAIIKVGRHFSRIRDLISEAGLLDRAGYVERATLEAEKVMPLSDVGDDCAPYFSMILVYNGGEPWS